MRKLRMANNTIILFLIILFFMLLFPKYLFAADAVMEDGILDLRNENIAEDGPFELDGEWEFYWKKLLTPSNMNESDPLIVEVPNVWDRYKNENGHLSKYGYATYRLNIKIREEDRGEIVSVYMPSIATAYSLWVNNKRIAKKGKIGTNRQQMEAGNQSQVVTFEIKDTNLDIMIRVSNFHQRKAGMWESIQFGTEKQITTIRERNVMFQMFIIGCIFIIGIYHLILFLFAQHGRILTGESPECDHVAVST